MARFASFSARRARSASVECSARRCENLARNGFAPTLKPAPEAVHRVECSFLLTAVRIYPTITLDAKGPDYPEMRGLRILLGSEDRTEAAAVRQPGVQIEALGKG